MIQKTKDEEDYEEGDEEEQKVACLSVETQEEDTLQFESDSSPYYKLV